MSWSEAVGRRTKGRGATVSLELQADSPGTLWAEVDKDIREQLHGGHIINTELFERH